MKVKVTFVLEMDDYDETEEEVKEWMEEALDFGGSVCVDDISIEFLPDDEEEE